jgi:hypothetical protein
MKQPYVVLSSVLLILLVGCNSSREEHRQDLVGIWTGKGIVGYQGSHQEWDVTLTLNENMTLTLLYESGERKFLFNGDYTVDLSQRPALIDIRNFRFPKTDISYCCMAIAEFPSINTMNICGIIGRCGEISRPTEFNRNPTDNHQLYHELRKKE